MKKLTLYWLVRNIVNHYFLSFFLVFLVTEMDGAFGRSDMKTKLLLQNIRTHLAAKADDILEKEKCESGLIYCKSLNDKKDEEEERSEEIRFSTKFVRGQQKPLRTKPKDIIQNFMPKVHKSFHQKSQTGKNERPQKSLHFPGVAKISESNDKSEEEVFDEDTISVQETRKSSDLLQSKQSVRSVPKLRQYVPIKTPKLAKKDSENEPALHSVNKFPKKKIKIDEEKSTLKNNKSLIKENEQHIVAKTDETIAELNIDEQELVKEAHLFSSGAFVFVLDSNKAQRNVCEKHSQIYLKQLKKFEMWALMMHDASAKLASGILQGNTNQYGDFDQCLSINAVFKKPKNKTKDFPGIKGKYCLANIDVKTNSKNKNLHKLQERIESFRFIKSTIHDPAHFIPRFSTVNWGLCVPSACLAKDVENFLKSHFEVFNKASGLVFDVKVEEENCVVKEDLKFKIHTKMLATILFYLTILSLSLYATCLDVKEKNRKLSKDEKLEDKIKKVVKDKSTGDDFKFLEVSQRNNEKFSLKEKGKSIIMAFSLKKNLEILLNDKNKGSIECVNGIKSIFTVLLYFAHKTIALGMTPFTNRVVLTKISNQPITVLLRASIVYTDSFLLISGVLTAYSLTKEISEKKEISWVKKSLGRFIRLTPPLLAVVLFYAFIWDQLGSGPTWNLVVKKNSLLCQRYMWRNLLYIQNFFEFENMCAPQTHQLALDMQLSLLAPLLVHLMNSYDKVGVGILQALFFISSILRYTVTSKNNLSVVIYHGMSVTQLYETANLLYAQAVYRASPYILGVMVGYYLKKFENQISIPKVLAALGWITALCFIYYSLASPYISASRTYKYNVQEAAQYAALSPIAWSLALSWVIIACHLGVGGKINEFLCKKIFLVFSRISYSVYLTQFLIFFYKIGLKKIPEMFTFADSFNAIEVVIVIIVSLIVTLFFDIPTMEIKKILLNEKVSKTFHEDNIPESVDPRKSFLKEYEEENNTISNESSQEITNDLTKSKKFEPKDEGEVGKKAEEEHEKEDGEEDGEEEREEDGEEDEDREGEEDEEEDEDREEDEEEDREEDEEEDEEEDKEEDGGDMKEHDVDEGSDENGCEEIDEENDEIIEAVFEIRPLTRSTRMYFNDESEGMF